MNRPALRAALAAACAAAAFGGGAREPLPTAVSATVVFGMLYPGDAFMDALAARIRVASPRPLVGDRRGY